MPENQIPATPGLDPTEGEAVTVVLPPGITVGRTVLCNSPAGVQCVGFIAHNWGNGLVNIGGFTAAGAPYQAHSVPYDETGGKSLGWRFPPRV